MRGNGFSRLWAASGVSNLGDGVYGTALPLLAATLTRDPLLVSLVSFAEWLPWLLFGLLSGALLDRWDRRRVMWVVDAGRFAVVGGLAVAVLFDQASIALLAAVGFLLGTGQTLVDTGAQSILPALVSRNAQRLEWANGRLVGTQVVTQELAGPPAGGFLFSAATWVPFAVDAVSFAAGSALVASIRGHFGPATGELGPGGRRATLRSEIAEGLRWLVAHRVLRATAAMVAVVNLLASGGGAVMVLFAQERLGLGRRRVRAAAQRVGGRRRARQPGRGQVGAHRRHGPDHRRDHGPLRPGLSGVRPQLGAVAGRRHVRPGRVPHRGLQRRHGLPAPGPHPDRLLGRVISAFRLFSYGSVPLGSLLGGVLARSFGLRAPFLVAGIVIPVVALLCLPAINTRTIAEARSAAGLEPRP
ncbi:MAG TPA: MFS transporter [Actinomycetota bacterium]